ncbi:MAG: hypothetical protein EON92_15685, partial [Burkholderiales bacterium]
MTTAVVGAILRRCLDVEHVGKSVSNWLAIFALQMLCMTLAHAVLPPLHIGYRYYWNGVASATAYEPAEAACAAVKPLVLTSIAWLPQATLIKTEVTDDGTTLAKCLFTYTWLTVNAVPKTSIYRVSLDVAGADVMCPANSMPSDLWSSTAGKIGCVCNSGYPESGNACGVSNNADTDPASAERSAGGEVAGQCTRNPIIPPSGIKARGETDWSERSPAALSFARIYRSTWAAGTEPGPALGTNWTHKPSARRPR